MFSDRNGPRLESKPALHRERAMGTVVSQQLYGIHAAAVAERAAAEIDRLEQFFSVYRPNSEVSRLGYLSGICAIPVQLETFAILGLAKHFHHLTRATLDVTSAALSALWQRAVRQGRPPPRRALDAALSLLGCDAIDLQLAVDAAPRAALKTPGQHLDLGALGKGYAADCCRELYLRSGLHHGILDLGGNVLVFGGKPDGSPFRVGIQRPDAERGRWLGYLELHDACVATSGSYERYFELDGQRYSHILDPRTGLPAETDALSATIVSRSGAQADALATACIVLGVEPALALIEGLPDAEAILLDSAGRVHLTSGLSGRFVQV